MLRQFTLPLVALASLGYGAPVYFQTNLTSDIPGMAPNVDPNLRNPWGMSFFGNSPFWVSNQVSNNSTLYNAAGVPQALVVQTPSGTTGQVFSNVAAFSVAGAPATFIFSSLSGTISGWNTAVNLGKPPNMNVADTYSPSPVRCSQVLPTATMAPKTCSMPPTFPRGRSTCSTAAG